MNPQIFLVAFFVYVVAMIVFGWRMSGGNQSGDDFLLGGRSLPFFLTLGTTLATMVGTGSSMGAVGKAYTSGWSGSLYGVGGTAGILLAAWIFAPVREHRFMTMAEEFSSYVGASKMVRNLSSVFIYLASVGWLGAHIVGGGNYLMFVVEMDPILARFLIAMGFGVYSVIGGYRAVVWTDSLQAIVLFCGFVGTAIFAWSLVGGWTELQEVNRQMVAKPALHSVTLVFSIAVGVLGTPSFRQRIYSGKSVGEIRKAFIMSAILFGCFALLPAIIGMAAYSANPNIEEPDLAFPYMATEMLPPAIGILVILAGLSATMSSASSDAIAGVTTIMGDVWHALTGRAPAASKVVMLSRVSLVLTCGLALGMALVARTVVDYITMMIGIFMTGMCVCGILGRAWPRFNQYGAVATLLSGSAISLLVELEIIANVKANLGGPVIPALVGSAIVGIVVSLLTPPDRLNLEEAVALLEKERRSGDKD